MKIYPVFFICLSFMVSLALGAHASSSEPVEKTIYIELYDVSGSLLVRCQNLQSPVPTEELHLAGLRWVWRNFESGELAISILSACQIVGEDLQCSPRKSPMIIQNK
jgi:hypothetical protein